MKCKFKLCCHGGFFPSAASFVNDPNLKRVEAHLGYLNILYGFKGELLMVQDGGHVSIYCMFDENTQSF